MSSLHFTDYPPICSVEGVKTRLGAFSYKPNKALGQNFLIDTQARAALIKPAPLAGAPVLEIGPGLGALTEGLLEAGAQPVVAVEKDFTMTLLLEKALMGAYAGRLHVLHGDILRLPFTVPHALLGFSDFYVAGNLPYYITTPIALRLMESDLMITGMTLLVQKEAAARFFADPGDYAYGPLAVASQCMYYVEKGISLSPASFYPQPAVYSTAVHLTRKEDSVFPGFIHFLKSVFAMRRKTMANNLAANGYSRNNAERLMRMSDIREDARAEALPPEALYNVWKNSTAQSDIEQPE